MPFCMLQPSVWIDSPPTVTNTRLDAFCVLFMRALPGLTHVATDSGSPCPLIQQMLWQAWQNAWRQQLSGKKPALFCTALHAAAPLLSGPWALSKRQLSTGTISSPELMQACSFRC